MSSTASTTDLSPLQPSLALRISLWVAQTLLFALFCFAGVTKVFTPIKELAQMMPWTGEYSVAFVRTIGLIDLAGGSAAPRCRCSRSPSTSPAAKRRSRP